MRENVKARSIRAASAASIVSRSCSEAKISASAVESSSGRLARSCRIGPSLETSCQMSTTRRWTSSVASISRCSNGQRRVDRPDRRFERGEIELLVERRQQQFVLVGEDPEDRAFGDLGGDGDLPARDRFAVFAQQRDDGGDDRGAPLVGWHGGRPDRFVARSRCRTSAAPYSE